MTKTFIISDSHFNHARILTFTDSTTGELIRPWFSSVEEMNETMIDNWNSVVGQNDKVYHLGDVMIGGKPEDILPRLNGKKTIIFGNHDNIPKLVPFFKSHYIWRVIREHEVTLSHFPLREDQLRTKANLHGHIHQNKSPSDRHYNVSAEAINYTPKDLDEIVAELRERGVM